MCKWSRTDLQLTVGFLCTGVRAPTEDDWCKLRRMIQYLRGSSKLGLTLEAENSHVFKWWIDAVFAVHADMKSTVPVQFRSERGWHTSLPLGRN